MDLKRDIVVIGASAGGVDALQKLAANLPRSFPASIFIVLHLWASAPSHLVTILSRAGHLPVRQPLDSEPMEPGTIYVAPPDYHMLIEDNRVVTVRGPRENRARPAINPLFRSAAAAFGPRVIGVILTGTLDDGAAGLWAIKQCGGLAIVQSDAAFDAMPKAAVESVAIDHHVGLEQIPALLQRLVQETIPPAPRALVPEVVQLNDEGAKMKTVGFHVDDVGKRSVFSCPECNGALWELDEGRLQYRCHVGHAYSSDTLKEAQVGTIEQSLWTALRALKESAALDERLAERAEHSHRDQVAGKYRESAAAKTQQAANLQEFLETLKAGK